MDLTVQRFSESWVSRWRAFVEARAGASMADDAPWLPVIYQAFRHQDRSLIAERDGEIYGILPMMVLKDWLFGTFHISLPWLDYGGIIADDAESAHVLLDTAITQAREDKAKFIELRSPDPVSRELPLRKDKATFRLPLKDADAVWKGLEPKVRNQVRKAQKSRLRCEFGRQELLSEFYPVLARNMRDPL